MKISRIQPQFSRIAQKARLVQLIPSSSYLRSMIYVVRCFHQIVIVFCGRCVVHFTVVCFCSILSKIKVDADTFMVQVTLIFTRVPFNHTDVCYGVVNKTFSIEKQSRWKC